MTSDAYWLNMQQNTLRRRKARRPGYSARVRESVGGLGCACQSREDLSGYRRINGYIVRRAVKSGLAGFGAPAMGVPELMPVSDKSAVAAAIRLFQSRRGSNLAGIGNTEQTQGAAAGAATGAKAGSIIPGVGTVIGAFVGAVVGWLAAKSKPVRATAEQLAQCQTLTTEYMGYAAQYPTSPLPLELPQIKDLIWCGNAIHGAMVKLKDPRFFTSGFDEKIAAARQIVRKVYETPVGQTIEITGLKFTDAKGRKIDLPGISFVNQPFVSILELTQRVMVPFEIKNCEPWGKGACTPYFDIPLIRRTLFDLLGYAARTELPNISEADLVAASQVAANTGSSSSDVVKAVESIINRPVNRGETSALLTGQSDVPGVIAPTPTATPDATAPPLPGVTPQTAADVTALITQLLAQGTQSAQVAQSALDALAARNVPITPQVTSAVQQEVSAQSKPNLLLIAGGGALAFMLLARPARRTRR